MKTPRTTAVFGLLVALLYSPLSGADELVIFTWEEYLDPAVIEEFYKETGTQVREVFYDTDESKNDTLAETNGGEGFDLLVGSGFSLQFMQQSGWLAPLPESSMPNLRHLHPKWRKRYPQLRSHAVPYFWGTVGLAYRADLVEKPDSWMDFFRPAQALKRKLLLIDDSKDGVGLALKALGHDLNSNNQDELHAAHELLNELKPSLLEIGYFDLTEDSAFASGELLMAMGYSGDVLSLQEHVPQVSYTVPREGTNLWIDYIAVLSVSRNKEAASEFIDFLNRPRVAARNAKYVYYATPNKTAEQYLDQEFLNDPILYPSAELLEKSETFEGLSIPATRSRTRIWAQYAQ